MGIEDLFPFTSRSRRFRFFFFFSFSSRMGIPQRKLTFIPKRVRIFRYVYLDRTSTSSEWYLLLQYNLYNPENRITSNNRPP